MALLKLLLICTILNYTSCSPLAQNDDDDDHHHHKHHGRSLNPRHDVTVEALASYWQDLGKKAVKNHRDRLINTKMAKNVIFFIGDGLSIPTLAAARAYLGQSNGDPGEETQLSFEKFPIVGLAKTYCVDVQVADSACTATAYLCGVKANDGTIGVSAEVPYRSCDKLQDTSTHVESIAKKFLDFGRSAGIVTTTRVTHASPAGVYAHTADRGWENDGVIVRQGHDATKCRDIAHQLIHNDPGNRLQVILGGGRRELLPNTTLDEEDSFGLRWDNRNLIEEWKNLRIEKNQTFEYVWNKNQLLSVAEETDHLMGLFESGHCQYHLLGNPATEPSLTEMVEAAIKVLSKNDKGFFLFAEGGRIDHAHHDTRARLALDETVEFSKAIAKAVEMTNSEDTLIVVSSDHSHVMTHGGYSDRGNPILGPVGYTARDGLPFMSLSYANGPGYRAEVDGQRVDVTHLDIDDPNFNFPAMVPLNSETHGGDDVAVFALGPWQHLFTGIYEQSVIPYLLAYASCVGNDESACSSAALNVATISTTLLFSFILCISKII